MDKKFLSDIEVLKKAIDSHKLVVFGGAGVSIDSGVPLWAELIKALSEGIDLPCYEVDDLRIAQMYFNDRDAKEYTEKVRSVLKHKKTNYNPIHSAIFDLRPEHIITTNYDEHFEQVIRDKALPFSVVTKDEDFPFSLSTNLLVKMHGDLSDVNIVLKEDDYLDYSLSHPLIEGFIKSVFASKVVVFIGYSFSDINLKQIIHHVRTILGKNFQNAYLLTMDDNMHAIQKDYLKNKGVKVIAYTDGTGDKGDDLIEGFLRGDNHLHKTYYQDQEGLSPKGQKLYNFLRFVSNYDVPLEKLKNQHPIEKIYHSLKRFEDLPAIPSEFLARLYPFNAGPTGGIGLDGYTLIITAGELKSLFYDELDNIGNNLTLNERGKTGLTEQKIKELNAQLESVRKRLNRALIFYIQVEDPAEKNTLPASKTLEIFPLQQPSCDCLGCCYDQLSFDKVIRSLQDSDVMETSPLADDICLAYIEYKMGNFIKSYHLYEKLANKAWRTNNFITYFLAKTSIKNLNNLIRFHETAEQNVINEIVDQIAFVDLDKILVQLTGIDQDQYKLLADIKDERFFRRYISRIEEHIAHINRVYQLYEDNGSINGSANYVSRLEIDLSKLLNYLSVNRIVFDEYKEFTDVLERAIEALLVSYATDHQYAHKLNAIDGFILDMIIAYGNADKFEKLLKKYQIHSLSFLDNTVDDLISRANNFLKSNHHISTLLGKRVLPNNATNARLQNHFFKTRYNKVFQVLMLLLSQVDLAEKGEKELIETLLNYLDKHPAMSIENIETLKSFMIRHGRAFSIDQIRKLLNLSAANKDYRRYEGFVTDVIEGFSRKDNSFLLSDDNLEKALISTFSSADLLSLWNHVSAESQELIRSKVKADILSSDKADVYYKASLMGVINYRDYFADHIADIDKRKGSGIPIQIKNWVHLPDYGFYNFIMFTRKMKIPADESLKCKFTNLSDFYIFLMDPENFDYSKFDPVWLLVYGVGEYIGGFKNMVPVVAEILHGYLSKNYNPELSRVYFKKISGY
ncbi:SIR2 family protein [Mucilaginibacter angelicae]|uniref:SIR2 family protein n=2 Tax=Mucilaginibacter angelicae TaxID=869718 RepID=A0ABV6L197_9SPHI